MDFDRFSSEMVELMDAEKDSSVDWISAVQKNSADFIASNYRASFDSIHQIFWLIL
jgi:hypothetical protein